MDLDFIESSTQNIPREHLKSSTVETLIAQNEDLMLKFKTALRRLSTMEEQNQQILEDHMELKRQNSILHDQTAVLKEKDQVWKNKVEQIETEKLLLAEKNIHLQENLNAQSTEIIRYQKYHDKIKTQVKPYLQQLRKYSSDLELQNKSLQSELENRNSLIRDLRHQIVELAKNSQAQAEEQAQRLTLTVDSYEKTLEKLQYQLESESQLRAEADVKIVKYHKVQEKCDRLENDLIEMQRSRESIKLHLEDEVLRLQNNLNEVYRDKVQAESQNIDLREQLEEKTKKAQYLEQSQLEMTQQLESLRYLFGTKSQENERLKMSIHSLEKLNVELSQKIHEIRCEAKD